MRLWPFRSLRVQVLEREQLLLQARIRDLEARASAQQADVDYFRTRYEKLADEVLFRRGEIVNPVHVEPPKERESIGTRVMRVANIAGGTMPQKGTPHAAASGAELPGR